MRYLIVFTLLLAITACDNQYRSTKPFMVVDNSLRSDIGNPEVANVRVRSVISFNEGVEARNCVEYLNNLRVYALDEAVNNQLIKSEYLSCEALALIQASTLSRFKPIEASLIGMSLLKYLDLRTFPSSLGMRADDEAHTLDRLFPDHSYVSGYSAGFENADWQYEVRVIAQGDLNGNDQVDWIVWLSDKSKTGNYSGYSTLVVLDPSPEYEVAAMTFVEYQDKREP